MTLLYFAPVPWDSYSQRPHHVVSHFLERGGRSVIWVNPYPTRLPTLSDARRVRHRPGLGPDRPPNLSVVSVRAWPIEPWPVGRWINRTFFWNTFLDHLRSLIGHQELRIGIGRPSALAVAALKELRPAHSFYDAMDDFPEFYSGVSKVSVRALEQQIVQLVDVVVTASSELWRKFSAMGHRRRFMANAFDMSALPPPSPPRGRPVFGYVGCIGSWFDWSLIVRLADAFPDFPVHIAGPCYAQPPRRLPQNVQLFPACAAARAVEHFQSFSVGIIPFKRSPLTDAVDPVKYYGYRAMGLPVLSTAFGEMAHRGVGDRTFLIGDCDAVAETAGAALASAGEDGSAAEVMRFRAEHGWRRRLEDARFFESAEFTPATASRQHARRAT
jgi:hypothetical protein